jgi:DHA3 family tetracycline resistance protein-like MFS transporter
VRRADPVRLYLALRVLQAMGGGWVVFDLFLVRDLRLSALQLVLMGTVMEATIFVFEVPTGVVADTYSRRLSLIVGFLGMGAAVVGVAASSTPWIVIALWGFWGLSYTFTSGAYDAWIADEVGAENVGSLFLRGTRVGLAGSLAGLAVGVAVGAWSLRASVIVGGVFTLACGLVCIVAMPEHGFRGRPRGEREHALRELRATATTAARFVRAQTLVTLLVATELVAGFGAEAFDRLTEAHVIRDVGIPASIDPVFAFGAVSVVTMVFGFAAVTPLIRRVERDGTPAVARMLVVFTVATTAGQIAFALGRGFWLVMTVFLAALLARGLLAPLYTTWLNGQIGDSRLRATVLSLSGQANAIGQATGGPVLGIVGNTFGIPAALVVGAMTTLPAAALYARALRHGGGEPELEALAVPSDA